jgi:hypothetical protein
MTTYRLHVSHCMALFDLDPPEEFRGESRTEAEQS